MRSSFLFACAVIGTFLLLSACDNPVEDEDGEHAEAEGFVLLINGTEVVRNIEAQTTGRITVPVGSTTSEIEIEFLDHDGELLHAEDLEEELSLIAESDDPSKMTVETTGRWTFVLHGVSAGSTNVQIGLMHGDHPDLQPRPVPVDVQ